MAIISLYIVKCLDSITEKTVHCELGSGFCCTSIIKKYVFCKGVRLINLYK